MIEKIVTVTEGSKGPCFTKAYLRYLLRLLEKLTSAR